MARRFQPFVLELKRHFSSFKSPPPLPSALLPLAPDPAAAAMYHPSRLFSGSSASTSGMSGGLFQQFSSSSSSAHAARRQQRGSLTAARAEFDAAAEVAAWEPAVDSASSLLLNPLPTLRSEPLTATRQPLPEPRAAPNPHKNIAFTAVASITGEVTVEGTVERVNFRSDSSDYAVLRLSLSADSPPPPEPTTATAKAKAKTDAKAAAKSGSKRSARRRSVTVVGDIPHVVVGQSLRLTGAWAVHPQYGEQLKVSHSEKLTSEASVDLEAYLGGGVVPGVGPRTAEKMVAGLGGRVMEVLDSEDAVEMLSTCEGIGPAKAKSIKEGWDSKKTVREASTFLKDAGVPNAVAQKVVERLREKTREAVLQDPYHVLRTFKMVLPTIDRVAAKLGAPADLVSRGSAAVLQSLATAANRDGHTYLTAERLETEARRMLEDLGRAHGNPWPRMDLLKLIMMQLHAEGALVAEPAPEAAPFTDAEIAAIASDGSSDLEEIKATVSSRTGATVLQLEAMLAQFGAALPAVLNLPVEHAQVLLKRCKRFSAATAKKVKARWDAKPPPKRAMLRPSMRIDELEAAPLVPPFPWTPGVRCYLPRLHAAERSVAAAAAEKAALATPLEAEHLGKVAEWIRKNQEQCGVALSQGQIEAIKAASDAPIMVITGGPGCGKTTVVQFLVKLWCAQSKLVEICAPTGRAAQRIGDIQDVQQLITPCTIHRLLGYTYRGGNFPSPKRSGTAAAAAAALAAEEAADMSGGGGDGGFFSFNAKNTLQADAVLVDEASMLSLPLAASLMQALESKTQLVLIGDADQLPPVGPGSVLRSLIASGMVPVVDLREVFRQAAASAIVTSALAVRHGRVPRLYRAEPTAASLRGAGTDALIVRAPNSESVPELVYKTVSALMQGGKNGCGFAEKDLQVVSPMRKGPAGTGALNLRLQKLLNPPGPGKAEVVQPGAHPGDRVFRVGDRVLQTVNNYDKEVFNGDQGYVVEADPGQKRLVVEFEAAATRGSRRGWEDNEELAEVVDEDAMAGLRAQGIGSGSMYTRPSAASGDFSSDGRIVYTGIEMGELELAYAVTVHKAQGGESRGVVMALSHAHRRMLSRSLLYTGLTRAKEMLVLVAPEGHDDPLEMAVARVEVGTRLSSLEERLEAERVERNLPALQSRVYSNEEEVLTGHGFDGAGSLHFVDATAPAAGGGQSEERSAAAVAAAELCRALGLSDDEVAALIPVVNAQMEAQTQLVALATVQSHLKKLRARAEGGELPPVAELLRLAPALLGASSDYFDRGLEFSIRLGPLHSEDDAAVAVSSGEEGSWEGGSAAASSTSSSLVDQLRRVWSARPSAAVE